MCVCVCVCVRVGGGTEQHARSWHGVRLLDFLDVNCCGHAGIERKLKDPKTIELLFDELAHNIAYSFYPVTLDEAVHLAAKALRAERLDMAKKGDVR